MKKQLACPADVGWGVLTRKRRKQIEESIQHAEEVLAATWQTMRGPSLRKANFLLLAELYC